MSAPGDEAKARRGRERGSDFVVLSLSSISVVDWFGRKTASEIEGLAGPNEGSGIACTLTRLDKADWLGCVTKEDEGVASRRCPEKLLGVVIWATRMLDFFVSFRL